MVRTTKPAWAVAQITADVVEEAIGQTGGPLREESFFMMGEAFFTSAHTAYLAKSHGQADEFGDTWRPLAASTIREKLGLGSIRDPGTPRPISPSVTGGTAFIPDASRRQEWTERRDNFVAQMISSGMTPNDAKTKANDLTWGANIAAAGVPINVDTGLLANSLAPGGGGDRSVRQGQVRQMVGQTMTFGTDVDYAASVHERRPILPDTDKMVVWVRRGLDIVTNLVKQEIEDRLR